MKRRVPPRSLTTFARDKRRAGCPVCALPKAVREQLGEARAKKISRAVQLEWLRAEHGAKLTDTELTVHVNGRHDAEDPR